MCIYKQTKPTNIPYYTNTTYQLSMYVTKEEADLLEHHIDYNDSNVFMGGASQETGGKGGDGGKGGGFGDDGYTMKEINEISHQVLKDTFLVGNPLIMEYYNKIRGQYRWIDEIDKLRSGRFIRWLNTDNLKLTNGGICCSWEPSETGGIIITCKSVGPVPRFMKFNFNHGLTFQKMTDDEKIILELRGIINSHDHPIH